ncbi:hypothetical protein H4R34_002479 [Dimargaris verticillata]|uniref:Uncharacterized protein n=1 Tax=Dimargaris verticillata TaxID=2761393 RepID=A0A9W8ECV3_9FUNG|nr:hypothetical protein H4R34_002479 [Dimargaris verticillata]
MHIPLPTITLVIVLALSASVTAAHIDIAPEKAEVLLARRSLPTEAFVSHRHRLQRRSPAIDRASINYEKTADFWRQKDQNNSGTSTQPSTKHSEPVKESKSKPMTPEKSKAVTPKRSPTTKTMANRPPFQSFVNPKKLGL